MKVRNNRYFRFNYSQKILIICILAILFVIAVIKFSMIWSEEAIRDVHIASEKLDVESNQSAYFPSNPVKNTEFSIIIPKINVAAPIIPNIDGNNKTEYLNALERGVAHFKNTAKPNENGNMFIFGHSSDWRWNKGDYKTVFMRLPEIIVGDEIYVWYQGTQYHYKVSETHIVDPTDISWLQPTEKKSLTLSTCYPIHSNSKRFIVRAMQIGNAVDYRR